MSQTHPETFAPVPGPLVTPVTVTLLLFVIAGVTELVARLAFGLGAVTNLNNGYPWGIWIAYDVVCGSALGGGGFTTALLVYILNRGRYHPLVRPALIAAALGYTQAGISIMLDLGRYWDFWHLFVPSYMQVNSTLFEVAVCMVAYSMLLWIEFLPVVLERFGLEEPRRKLDRILFFVIALGVLLPMMHQSSLGTLLVVFGPQVHPLYQSMLLPVLFLTSTMGMGFAAVTVEGAFSSVGLRRPFEKEILAGLMQIGRVLMAVFFVVRILDLFWRGAIGYAFEPSWPMLTFWIEMALLSVPLWLLATPAARNRARNVYFSAFAMALGGIVYRLAAFLVAYDTGAGWHYFPSIGELALTFGLFAFEILGIILAIRLLPILPAPHAGTRAS